MRRDVSKARLRAKGIKVLYEDSGLIILAIHHADIDFLSDIMAKAGGSFQGGGSVYSFKLPVVEGDFRLLFFRRHESRRSGCLVKRNSAIRTLESVR